MGHFLFMTGAAPHGGHPISSLPVASGLGTTLLNPILRQLASRIVSVQHTLHFRK